METILVIDDEPGIRSVLKDILTDEGYRVLLAEDGLQGLSMMSSEPISLVILDIWLPKMGGMDVLKEIKKEYPIVEVIVISGHANIDMAVKAVKEGAFDFIEKPLSLERVITLIGNALALGNLKQENLHLKESLFVEDDMIGQSPSMKKIRELIRQSATSDAKVLITGDNGTGKELVAREIHRRSSRSSQAFIEVNCAAIPDTLIESELFGHEKGSFTGAQNLRRGKFETAHKGTLFLDEVADMSLSAQAKVLRAIQEMRFERVGGEQSITVDVRILAATNKDIQEEIREGRFREDLYFRLNVIPIEVPPLRERKEDIPLLINYFMKRLNSSGEGTVRSFTPEAQGFLAQYPWPGNIRELKNFTERVNIMTETDPIPVDAVRDYIDAADTVKVAVPEKRELEEFMTMKLSDAREEFERRLITRKLEDNQYNISRAAEELGVYPSNLHGKIKKLGIEVKK